MLYFQALCFLSITIVFLGKFIRLTLYIIYVAQRPRWLIVVGQSFHGLAYVFFIIAGQMFAGNVAAPGTEGSMQAMVFTATTGIGLFVGTHLAGVAMDKFRDEERFQWSRIYAVPAIILGVCIVVFVALFKVPAGGA